MNNIVFSIRKYAAVIAILMVLIMTVLDVTVINVALPVLAVEFGVSDSYTVWIITAYQLVITMLLLPLSSAGDLYSLFDRSDNIHMRLNSLRYVPRFRHDYNLTHYSRRWSRMCDGG